MGGESGRPPDTSFGLTASELEHCVSFRVSLISLIQMWTLVAAVPLSLAILALAVTVASVGSVAITAAAGSTALMVLAALYTIRRALTCLILTGEGIGIHRLLRRKVVLPVKSVAITDAWTTGSGYVMFSITAHGRRIADFHERDFVCQPGEIIESLRQFGVPDSQQAPSHDP